MLAGVPKNATRYGVGKVQGYTGLAIRDELRETRVDGPRTPVMVTAWIPTPDELALLNAGAPIMVEIMGQIPPPMNVRVGDTPE
jgi:hypothetical protein